MKLSNGTYDILKWIALIALPAFATLYISLANIWGWGGSEQIAATITAIDTFIGVILGISSRNYEPDTDGILTIKSDQGGTVLDNLQLNDPDTFVDKDKVVLDVKAKHLKSEE